MAAPSTIIVSQFHRVEAGSVKDLTSAATANTTTTLTNTSTPIQFFTGTTAGQILKLPDATNLLTGWTYEVYNTSTQSIAVQDNAGGALRTVKADQRAIFVCSSVGSAAGLWENWFSLLTDYKQIFTATADVQTTSLTDVLMTGMTTSGSTPPLGVYYVSFEASALNSNNNASALSFSLYLAAVQQATTVKTVGISGGANASVGLSGYFALDGATDVNVRWHVGVGTGTVHQRQLIVTRWE